MKPLNNKYVIKADSSETDTVNILGANGERLVISKNFNPAYHNTQFGEIYELPYNNKFNLQVKDKVFFHHLVTAPENKIIYNGEEIYFAKPDTIYAKVLRQDIDVKGTPSYYHYNLQPLGDLFFAERIMDEELEHNGIILKEYAENINQIVKAVAVNDYLRSQGIKEGDILITVEGAGVPIKESNLCWLKLHNVFGKIVNNDLIPLKDKAIILESITNEDSNFRFGMIVSNLIRNRFLKGVLLNDFDDLLKGQIVTFIHGAFTRFVWNDVKYAVVGREDMIMVNN